MLILISSCAVSARSTSATSSGVAPAWPIRTSGSSEWARAFSRARSFDVSVGGTSHCSGLPDPAKMPGRPSYWRVLSTTAGFILDRMEPDRTYRAEDLRALVPDAGVEPFRAIMHELWVNRQVERVGELAWRRHRSAPPHIAERVSRDIQAVRPEDLFDHGTFADFFK